MIDLLLQPRNVLWALIALAVATPIAAWLLRRNVPPRVAIIAGAAGPFALGYWGFHNLVLKHVGFDSIWSAVIVVGLAAVLGVGAGEWIRRGNDAKQQ